MIIGIDLGGMSAKGAILQDGKQKNYAEKEQQNNGGREKFFGF